MKHVTFATLALAALAPLGASAQEEMGRVISSTPIIQQVAVPRQVCSDQPVMVPQQRSGAGAVIGAIAGGAMGNAIGDGTGRAAATAIGIIGGAMLGDRIEGGGGSQVQQMQQCTTQTFYENRTVGYNVIYEYAGKQYNVQMPNDPGPYVRLQIRPIGANSLPAPPVASQPYVDQGQAQAYPVQPVYGQPVYSQPVYPQPVYVQPTISSYTTYVPQRPAYYAAPISFSFGYVHRDYHRHPRTHNHRPGRDPRHWR